MQEKSSQWKISYPNLEVLTNSDVKNFFLPNDLASIFQICVSVLPYHPPPHDTIYLVFLIAS